MINKIVKISNTGKFTNYCASSDVSMEHLTLIYGENGAGKTTIATILRSLQSGMPNELLAKRTIGCTDDQHIHLRIDDSSIEFKSESWTTSYPNLLIFDSNYVNENVFSGDFVTSEHKKSLHQIVIGNKGVQLANKIDELNSNLRTLQKDQKNIKDKIKLLINSQISVDEFIEFQELTNIETKIKDKKEVLEIANNKEKIQKEQKFKKIEFSIFDVNELQDILNSSIGTISEASIKRVKDHLSKVGEENKNGIITAQRYLNDHQECPICGQSVDGVDLINSISQYFSEEYQQLNNKIESYSKNGLTSISENNSLKIISQIKDNEVINEFWKSKIDYKKIEISTDEIKDSFSNLYKAAHNLVDQKRDNIIDQKQLTEEFSKALEDYNKLLSNISEVNKTIDEINLQIEILRSTIDKSDPIKIMQEISDLKLIELRNTEDAKKLCNEYQIKGAEIEKIKKEKDQKRKDLDDHSEDLLSKYQTSINKYMKYFSPDIQIANAKTDYRGKPSTSYSLLINNQSIPIGSTRETNEPSFTTILSDGEKNALAFSFFLAQLEQDECIQNKILVIDDPITSLDRNRRNCTKQEIVKFIPQVSQAIILSHDPYFLLEIWESCSIKKTLCIIHEDVSNKITEWDIQETTKNSLIKNFELLNNYVSGMDCDKNLVAKTIRIYLEGYLKIKYPLEFRSKEWTGNFIEKIRNSKKGDSLFHLKGEPLDELIAVNDYAKKFHHDQNQNPASYEVVEAELKQYVSRALELRLIL
jgi:wobble nucleotide-excising tRNase